MMYSNSRPINKLLRNAKLRCHWSIDENIMNGCVFASLLIPIGMSIRVNNGDSHYYRIKTQLEQCFCLFVAFYVRT